ncbi:MAG: acyl-CoA reductase [Chitinophagaceae bacterium]
MNLQERIDLLVQLGKYMLDKNEEWKIVKEKAYRENAWFLPEFIELSATNIATFFLDRKALENWINIYQIPAQQKKKKTIGVVMAGNIPLVGFHDFLCVFISGNKIKMRPSSKDFVLIKHIITKLTEWNADVKNMVLFADILKNCDAYIATGSNNSQKYFEYYFAKYAHIIRHNKTSIAVLDENENAQQLNLLADDMQLYFGLGCRNVTKIYVPENYDFLPLLNALKKYDYFLDFHKYKNNFDYQLALLVMNNKKYMNNGSVLFTENTSVFSAVSCIYYEFYNNEEKLLNTLQNNPDIQCIVGKNFVPFGKAQQPSLTDYADGIDTMKFLMELSKEVKS